MRRRRIIGVLVMCLVLGAIQISIAAQPKSPTVFEGEIRDSDITVTKLDEGYKICLYNNLWSSKLNVFFDGVHQGVISLGPTWACFTVGHKVGHVVVGAAEGSFDEGRAWHKYLTQEWPIQVVNSKGLKPPVNVTGATIDSSQVTLGTSANLCIVLENPGNATAQAAEYDFTLDYVDVKSEGFDAFWTQFGDSNTKLRTEEKTVWVPEIPAGETISIRTSLDFETGESPSLLFTDRVNCFVRLNGNEIGNASVSVEVTFSASSVVGCLRAALMTALSHLGLSIDIPIEQVQEGLGNVDNWISVVDGIIVALNSDNPSEKITWVAEQTVSINVQIVKALLNNGTLTSAVFIYNFLNTLWDGAWDCGTLVTFTIGYLQEVTRELPDEDLEQIFPLPLPSEAGNINYDNVLNDLDVQLCLQIATGVFECTTQQRAIADIDGDGDVDMNDAKVLFEYIIGIRSSLP